MALTKVSQSMIRSSMIDFKDYGAVGDGVTNDSAAITNAINGNHQFIVDGNFYVATAVELNQSGPTVEQKLYLGYNGSGYSDFTSSFESDQAIALTTITRPPGPGGITASIIIENIGFEGDGSAGQVGCLITDMTQVIFRNCTFRSLEKAIQITGSNFVGLLYFENCNFITCGQATDIVTLQFVNVVHFTSCQFKDMDKGLVFDNGGVLACRNVTIDKCLFEEVQEESILFDGQSANFVVTNSYFESNIAGKAGPVIEISAGGSPIPGPILIEGNTFSEVIDDAASSVINLVNCSGIQIRSNYSIFSNTTYPGAGTSIRLTGTEFSYQIENLQVPFGEVAKQFTIYGVTGGGYRENTPTRPETVATGSFLTSDTTGFGFSAATALPDTATILGFSKPGIFQYAEINSCETSVATPNAAHAVAKFWSGTTSRSINAAGTINASGTDYAEYMTKNGDFTIAKGDICGIDANGLLTNKFSDAVSFVVKSTNPSYVGGDTWGTEDKVGKPPKMQELSADASEEEKQAAIAKYNEEMEAFAPILEAERQKVDRIAFAGQVPVNVAAASVGQYIVAENQDDAIVGVAVDEDTMTLQQYAKSVGKVIAIKDGKPLIIVKVA